MKPIRLMTGFVTVGLWTLLSRVLGFVRDAMILGYLGTGPLYEAYVVAFRLPNMFRRFFAEGAFNMAFVPIFSKKLEGQEDPNGFASDAFSGLAAILIGLTILAMATMPWLIYALASGFAGQEQFGLTVEFGRIVFPYILFISLAALLSGVLNASGRFAAAATAPVLLNVLLVAAMATAAWMDGDVARTLIWAIPVTGVAQLALVYVAARRAGFNIRLKRPRYTPDMKHLVRVAVPAALAGGVVQINLLVGQQVASYFDKAVGWLYAADRLYQLPLGVVGIAMGVVLLPALSRFLKAGDVEGSKAALSRSAEIALALTIPSSVALLVVPFPIVSVLFERGAATVDDTAAIAVAVSIYAVGLPAFVLQKILQPVFFAREDTVRPFRYAVVSMIANAALAIGLAPFIGWLAPAVATTLAAWLMVALLGVGAQRYGDVIRFDARFHKRIWRILIASAIMGVVLWISHVALSPFLGLPWWRGIALCILISIGIVTFFGVGQMIGALRLSEFKSVFRRNG